MPSQVCPECHSTQLHTDTTNNELVCTNCGRVMEESRIVSEVTFGETSSGAAVVTGSFVGADQAYAGGGARGPHGHQTESRLQTIEKTRVKMSLISARLEIEDHIQERAVQFFKLALSHGFVKGRRSQYVVSACLYVACRQNKTTHMLMDFAEAIFVNVFAIGATYLQLVKALNINDIPLVDPSIFIKRFVSKLSFGEEGSKRVMDDANRLAHRMNRDWLVQGRRPAGIAASCVLLAARMNNFRRSKAEIVQVAKIAEETVQRRLDEFGSTSAATLTVSDFRSTQIESEADPPSFTKHREKERRLAAEREQAQKEVVDPKLQVDPDLEEMVKDLDEQDQQSKREGKTRVKRQPSSEKQSADTNEEDFLSEGEGTSKSQEEKKQDEDEREGEKEDEGGEKDDEEGEKDDEGGEKDDEEGEKDDEEGKGEGKGGEEEENDDEEEAISHEIDETMKDPTFKELSRAQLLLQKYREQKEVEAAQAASGGKGSWVSTIPDDPASLSDVDDDEVNSFVLGKEESKIKEQIWMSLNRDYLIEQERKRIQIESDKKAGIYKEPKKRRKTKPKEEDGEEGTTVSSPAEGAKQMLQKRAFSKKLNYDVMQTLFKNKF
jgi:transcription factor IIIB subunit 2